MTKTFTMTVSILAAAMFLCASARAQQTPAASTSQAPASSSQQTPVASSQQSTETATAPALTTQKDKESYALGLNIGKGLSHDQVNVDPALVARGIEDALSGTKPLLTDEETQAALSALQSDVQKSTEARMQLQGATNQAQGQAFLAANKTKDGVVTLPSGLQYKILTAGTGPKPLPTDSVVCNYRGTLIDGTEFDSSYKRGQPATFPVNRVIKGWTEALQLMPTGSKWQLFIPSDLAYGARGAGGQIGPNATLIFEVELISIQGK